jgi:hypothetical protein
MVYVLCFVAGFIAAPATFYALCCYCEYVDARDGLLRHSPCQSTRKM